MAPIVASTRSTRSSAKTEVELVSDVLRDVLGEFQKTVLQELSDLKKSVRGDIEQLRDVIKADMDHLKTELRTELEQMRIDVNDSVSDASSGEDSESRT